MRGWLAWMRKPQGRAARHPRKLEIVFALTGYPSRTLSINLDNLKKAVMALGLAAFSWFAVTFYIAYSHVSNMEAIAKADAQVEKIATLKANNARLAEEREHMSQRLLDLQQRIEGIAVKVHGLVNSAKERFPVEQEQRGSVGGPAIPVSETTAGEILKTGLSSFDARLDELLPRLESTLEREAARPLGIPLEEPVEVSSHFGLRNNPFGKGRELHAGIDFPGATGTPVRATAAGEVDQAGAGGALGNYVAVEHGYGYRSLYGHLSKVLVKPGEQVSKGQVIGLLGSTGRSSGPHLHYALQYKGRTINPAPYVE